MYFTNTYQNEINYVGHELLKCMRFSSQDLHTHVSYYVHFMHLRKPRVLCPLRSLPRNDSFLTKERSGLSTLGVRICTS